MGLIYDEYERRNLDKIRRPQSEYETKRNTAAQEFIEQSNKAVDITEKPAEDKIQNQIKDVPGQFRDQYDANAIQRLIGQRQVEESMANMGLSNSGLNSAAQTGLAAQQSTADAYTHLKQQAAVDALNQLLLEMQAKAAAQKQSQAASVRNQVAAEILNNYRTLYQNAISNASSQYQTDTRNDMQQRQLAQKRELAEKQRAESARQAEQKMNYKYDTLNYQKEQDKKRYK